MSPVRRHEGDYYGTTSDRVFRFVPLYVDTEKMIHKNPSGRGKFDPPTQNRFDLDIVFS